MSVKKNISRFHFISHEGEGFGHLDLIETACQGGARWIQLRVKDKDFDEWKGIALDVLEICEAYKARLIINDNVELAYQIGAHGVHLGKMDMDPRKARERLGSKFIIGGTANTFEDIQLLNTAKVDYIGLGPYRFTSTKKKLSPILGLDGYKRILSRMNEEGIAIPVIAIGGIVKDDISTLISTGVYGVALSSAISDKNDKLAATKEIVTTIKNLKYA